MFRVTFITLRKVTFSVFQSKQPELSGKVVGIAHLQNSQ